MEIQELADKLYASLRNCAFIKFDADQQTLGNNPVIFNQLNVEENRTAPHFNMYFHRRHDGRISAEISYGDKYLLFFYIGDNNTDVKNSWRQSSTFDAQIEQQVYYMIDLICKI